MPELPGLWSITPIGGLIGFVVIAFIFLATSRIYTKRQHDEVVEQVKQRADEIIAIKDQRGNEWKETSGKWEAVATEAMTQLATIAPELKIVGDFFTKIQQNGATPHDDGAGGS